MVTYTLQGGRVFNARKQAEGIKKEEVFKMYNYLQME